MPGSDATSPLAADRLIGGRYRLDAPIARGGMAEVWAGHDEVLARPVAVKVLFDHLARDGAVRERFRREAVTAARLGHPNVVATFDTGLDGDRAYIVMELVPGGTLRDLLARRGPLPVPVAVSIGDQVAAALAAAHRAGLVHRDIKPANVLVSEDDSGGVRVKVTDFGIAKAAEEAGGDLTVTGTVIGTPKYLSPEQVEGREPDARADLYALGIILFEMVSGRAPFEGPTQMATALSHLRDQAPRLSSVVPGVPAALDDLVDALLAKDPAGRYPSGDAVRTALSRVGPGASRPPSGSPPPFPAASDATDPGPAPRPEPLTVVAPVRQPPPPPAPQPLPLAAPALSSASTAATPVVRRRRRWGPGVVVVSLVLIGGSLAAVLLGRAGHSGTGPAGPGSPATIAPATAALHAIGASVVIKPGHSPDNATDVGHLIEGPSAGGWSTDDYHSPTFGGLYPGIGVAIELSGTHTLRTLTVTSTTTGWTAQAYVGTSAPPAAGLTVPSTVYGPPTGSAKSTGTTTTIGLGGRSGSWVLLWLTSTGGPPYVASLTTVTVR